MDPNILFEKKTNGIRRCFKSVDTRKIIFHHLPKSPSTPSTIPSSSYYILHTDAREEVKREI
jgi:hypothetical protein